MNFEKRMEFIFCRIFVQKREYSGKMPDGFLCNTLKRMEDFYEREKPEGNWCTHQRR